MSTFRLDYPQDRANKRGINPQKWGVLINSTFPNAQTANAILNAWDLAVMRNLDVFAGHIAIVSQSRKIDGHWVTEEACWLTLKALVSVAHKTGAFAGIDPITFGPIVEHEFEGYRRKDGGPNEKHTVRFRAPEYAIATVYRFVAGQRCAFSETVFFNEIVPMSQGLPTPTWEKKPTLMLAKCTKAAALRIGFEECDYSSDEMDGQQVMSEHLSETSDQQSETHTDSPAGAHNANSAPMLNDQVFGEAITDFTQIPANNLKWLDRTVDTAITLGAFDEAIDNMRSTLNADAHTIAEGLLRAAETISAHPSGDKVWSFIGQARDHGGHAFGAAINQIDAQARGGRLPKEVSTASGTVLTFLQALNAA